MKRKTPKRNRVNVSYLKKASPGELYEMVQKGTIDMVDVVQRYYPRMSRKELVSKFEVK
ncbi:MAG: hypothetical protein KAX49_18745 [Halanaerobiales bacterium]|nr:hypothetical protein [Halanaerobiales bacterium]